MQKFSTLKSIPAYLPIVNIDTDMIIPKQFLKTIKRTGLGKNLFFEMRYDDKGKEINEFVLNKTPFNKSKILIAGKIKELSEYANRKEEIFVDLNEEKVIYGNNEVRFKVDPFKKQCLLEGLDDIALSLNKSKKIESFEKDLKSQKPWIFND